MTSPTLDAKRLEAAVHAARDTQNENDWTLKKEVRAAILSWEEAQAGEERPDVLIQSFWQELLDKDDRTSPPEYPEMCLITRDELFEFLCTATMPDSDPTAWLVIYPDGGRALTFSPGAADHCANTSLQIQVKSLYTSPPTAALAPPDAVRGNSIQWLSDDQVEWIVNDNAELGVKIGDQFFFLYKGRSLVYETGQHDDGSPMYWRHVFKREFGECCHPINHQDYSRIGTVSRDDSDTWQPLPVQPSEKEG